MKKKNLLIMGPPGSGKGTQAAKLAAQLNLIHLSTGNLLREEVARETPLGALIANLIDAGNYVSDELATTLLRNAMEASPAQGFILDGYPRTVEQVSLLENLFEELGLNLTAVVVLGVNEETLVSRLLQRAREEGREDDTEEVIRHRFAVYERETAPVLACYRAEASVPILLMDGEARADEVTDEIIHGLTTLEKIS